MQEALGFATVRELRRPFTKLILYGAPAPQLWGEFQVHLSLDVAVTMSDAALKHVDLMLKQTWAFYKPVWSSKRTPRQH